MELSGGTKKLLLLIADDWGLILILTAIFAFYFYYTATFDYFKKKGISYMKPVILLGNLGPRITAARSFHDYQMDIYNNFKGKRYGGMFEGRRPILYVIDSDLIKAIMIRDFDYFTDRNSLNSKEPRYLSRSLLNLKGAEWKGVRSTMTPVFSSHRLKNMLPLLQLCAKQMVDYFKQYDQKDVEMKVTMGRFTLETIGACAFGIKCDALTDKDSHFIKVAEKFDYMPKMKRMAIFFILMFIPKLVRLLNFTFLNRESTDELMRILQAAKAERRLTDSQKSDFLQILVDVARKENIEQNGNTASPDNHMDDDTIDAQCLLFLIAGYETSSTLLSFALHVLATRPDLQDRLRSHINETTHGKEMSYELLSELAYLEAFLLETLRMYPPVARVDRVVTKPYQLPGTPVRLDTGDVVAIPIYGIHMDPDYYPEPNEFRPERFMGDEKKNRPAHLFLAFGAGPRNCIGLRFAMISAKVAMVALMKNFKFSACPKTENPVTFDKRALLLKTKSGLWVRIEKLT